MKLWKVEDVVDYLRMSRSWLYMNAASGDLPSTKIGGSLRFDPDEIRRFVERRSHADAKIIEMRRH